MLQAGQHIDGYEVEGVVGEGGMATVYRVRNRATGALHALKVLTMRHPEVCARFEREARTQASLVHPGIVRVDALLDLGGEPALLMELIEGIGLDLWVHRHPDMPAAARDDLATQILEAVGYAHAAGVVHRDLKPANVLVEQEGGLLRARITDFGLAKVWSGAPSATRSGVALGTPRYMAPEQIHDSKSVDSRADVWSLGCLLYELYTGRPAFHRGALLETFQAVVDADYVDPTGEVSPRVAAAIRGALQPDLARRIPDVETLRDVLLGHEEWSPALPLTSSTFTPDDLDLEPSAPDEVADPDSDPDPDPDTIGTLDPELPAVPVVRTPSPPVVRSRRRRSRRWVWGWVAALVLIGLGWLTAAGVAGALVVGAAALPADGPEVERPFEREPERPRPRPRRPRRGR